MKYAPVCLGLVAVLTPSLVSGQAPLRPQTGAPVGSRAKPWSPPRTPDGHPDMQGIWTNATLTPLQRPPELTGKEYFTEQEAAAYERQRLDQLNVDRPENRRAGDPGSYNQAFWDRGTRVVATRRTSLVVDPSDGKIPPMTVEAQAKFERDRAEMARHPSDGPEDRNLSERCLMFSGVGPPMLPEPYNNNYQIVQAPGHVAIVAEMNHDVRTIPTDGRPRLPASVRQWHGDSRGRWEGDTLAVETTNVKFNRQSHFGVVYAGMTDENLRVTERFTLTGPNMILYRATIEDPTVYTRPWTIEETFTRAEGPIFEYACHEGNYGMVGILEGARAEERKAGGSR